MASLKSKQRCGTFLLLLALCICLSACSTKAKYQESLEVWPGTHVDELLKAWGPPFKSAELSDGGQVLIYEKRSVFQTGGFSHRIPHTIHHGSRIGSDGRRRALRSTTFYENQYVPVTNHQRRCSTKFIIDEAGIIESYSFEGNGCKAK